MSTPYGVSGCICWLDNPGDPDERWMPHAGCRYHGVLGRSRVETGQYRVVLPTDDDQCPEGLHSMFDPCPGGCLNEDDVTLDDGTPNPCPEGQCLGNVNCPRECPAPDCCGQPDGCCGCSCPPQEDDEPERRRAADCGVHGVDGCIAAGLVSPCPPTCGANPMDCPGPVDGRCLSPELAGPPTGCTCSVNEPKPCPFCAAVTEALSLMDAHPGPGDCRWGEPFSCRVHCSTHTTEQEQDDRPGVLAAIRRWVARLVYGRAHDVDGW